MFEDYIDKYRGLSAQSVDPAVYKESVDAIIASNSSVEFSTPTGSIEPIVVPSTDHDYTTNTTSKRRVISAELGISDSGDNIFTGPQIVINSDRILMNAVSDYILAFSKKGIALSSVGPVNIDSAQETIIASQGGVYLGPGNQPGPRTADQSNTGAPRDQMYDPMVLGNKLINILEDFVLELTQLKIATPQGEGYISATSKQNLQKIIARLPEILSTYAFVTGTKHEAIPGPIQPSTPVEEVVPVTSTPFGDTIPTGSISNSEWIHPLAGLGSVTSVPGNRINPVTSLPQNHGGLDLAAPRGTTVYAMNDGIVLRTNNSCLEGQKQCGGGLGNYVIIKHVGEIEAKYGHLATGTVVVQPGQPVKRGDVIGQTGNTGASSGPHIHVQMRALPGSNYMSQAIPSADVAGRLNPLDFFKA